MMFRIVLFALLTLALNMAAIAHCRVGGMSMDIAGAGISQDGTHDEMDMVAIVLISMPDLAEARKICEEVRAFAGTFDADDWAQGHIAGCFGDVAEAEKNTAEACRLRDVQIAHYEKVMATGADALKKNLKDGIASAKKNRAALACQ